MYNYRKLLFQVKHRESSRVDPSARKSKRATSFPHRISKTHHLPPKHQYNPEIVGSRMGNQPMGKGTDSSMIGEQNTSGSNQNIISNWDFSAGLQSWHPNSCQGAVLPHDSGHPGETPGELNGNYAVITHRNKSWQGLEQDITGKISLASTYSVSAFVRVSGTTQESADVQATLRLEYRDSATSYKSIGRASVSKERWVKLEGKFSLSTMPDRLVFYIEGPSPGIDLLIDSVVITGSKTECKGGLKNGDDNVILNPKFEDGLNNWSGRGCKIALHDSMGDGKVVPQSGKLFASATERTQSWNGIQQEITERVQRKLAYDVTAVVRVFGDNINKTDLIATLCVELQNHRKQYITISRVQATDKDWVQLKGKFVLNASPAKVVIYLEGPPSGVDILVNSLVIKHAEKLPPMPRPVIENPGYGINIIENSNLSNGTNGWFAQGRCTLSVATGSPRILPRMARDSIGHHEPLSGRYILVTNRTEPWMGPAQMITDKLKLFLTYQVSAWVRIGSGSTSPQNVKVALSVDDQWVNGGEVEVNDNRWREIGGSFRIEKQPAKVKVYVHGPTPGVDMMIAGLQIFPVDRQARFEYLKKQTNENRKREVILKFSGLNSGTFVEVKQIKNSFPLGSCFSRKNMDNEEFVRFFVDNFNWAVFENELKWYWTEPQQGNLDYTDADDMLAFCESRNIKTRGHCIFWEVDEPDQKWIQSSKIDMMGAVQNRLKSLLNRYKGKFKHYDVNNEMLHGSFYQDRLGKNIRSDMFKTANKLDPSALLFVNDYHIEDGCDGRSSPKKYIEHVLALQKQGAPVGGIGIQGHIHNPVGPIVCSALDKIGKLGLPIWFTEVDVSSINEHVRADDLEVILREIYAHPSVEGVMLWGFWEALMSRENSHLVNAEGEINEAGKRLVSLKHEWLSRESGDINDQGQFKFRGFYGSYNVNVQILSSSKKVSKSFVVERGDDSPLDVSIDL